jgi:uncharacterized membrane protein
MVFAIELVAIFCAGLFAGAAMYVTLVEHPARMECGIELAATEFGPSYRRASVKQALLAAVSFIASVTSWLLTGTIAWLVGGILIVLVIPFTLIVILPTNKKLLAPALDRHSDVTRQLLTHWGRLHAVRTMLAWRHSWSSYWRQCRSRRVTRQRGREGFIARDKEAVLR